MNKSLKTIIGKNVNSFLDVFNLKLTRSRRHFTDYRDYIPFKETIAGAKQASLSVGDYIDTKHNKSGATQNTIDEMSRLGVFAGEIDRVCEIGPGSGRYLDKVLKLSQLTIDFLSQRNCHFLDSFFIPMEPGKTECMVFVKQ